MGLSIGLISPTFNALIAENFQGKERSRMNGIQTSINGIGGAIFLSFGGIIASFGWRDVFLTYLYAALLFILVIAFLPKFPPIQMEQMAKGTVKLPKFFFAVAAAAGLHSMMFTLIPTNLSLFLSNNGIGTVASVGYLTAFALVGVFIGGLAVTRLSSVLKTARSAGFRCNGRRFLAYWFCTHGVDCSACGIHDWLSRGHVVPTVFHKTAEVVPKLSLTSAISLMLACVYACQFLSPLFVKV